MKTSFILCEKSNTQQITHVICVTYPAIFDYPGFNLISGSDDPKVRESAITWFENRGKLEVKRVRSQPSEFQKALTKVRENREQTDITVLAKAVGISDKFMAQCIDDVKWMGAKARIPMTYRQKFIETVENYKFLDV